MSHITRTKIRLMEEMEESRSDALSAMTEQLRVGDSLELKRTPHGWVATRFDAVVAFGHEGVVRADQSLPRPTPEEAILELTTTE